MDDSTSFGKAIAAFKKVLKVRIRQRLPLYWAATQNNLGNALMSLGESETAHFKDAVAAYREALKERTRARVRLEWTQTQNTSVAPFTGSLNAAVMLNFL